MNDDTTETGEFTSLDRLVVGRQSPTLRGALWDLVRSLKGCDPLEPITVVSPSRYASLSLRQELGRQGFANVKFIELPMLAELLGSGALAGRRPLTRVLESIHLRQVLEQANGPLGPVRGHRSTQDSLRVSFAELRRLDDAALSALDSRGGVPGEVARLYRKFRSAAAGNWYDVEDLAVAAAEAVRQDAAPALLDLGQIVFYLPRRVSPAQSALMASLAERERCAVVLGLTGDEATDGPVREMAAALARVMGDPGEIGDGEAGLSALPGEAHLHVAPNTHEELRWVIRRIAEEATLKGIPFHRMAILYRMENPYGTLVRDELRLAGLPMAGPGRDSLSDTSVGRTLTGLLELSQGGFTRAEVMAWLTGCPVRPPGASYSGFNPSRWDSLTRRAGIVGGLDQWRDRLGGYARKLVEDADRREADGEITEARGYRMREEAGTGDTILAFIEKLAVDVSPPDAGSSWADYCDWAGRLLHEYLSPDIPDAEFGFRERIDRVLEELRGADRVRPSTTSEEFRSTVADALRAVVGHLGATGQGIFVSSFNAAEGMSFDVIWLVGMIEGGTPPSLMPDPLLPEPVWRDAGGHPRSEERIAQERYDYLLAVGSAPRRFLSYPVADAASQRQAHPSRWLLEQASVLEGRPVHARGLVRLGDRPWLSVDVSAQSALDEVPDTSLADGHDYYLDRLLRWRNAGGRMGAHPLAGQGMLSRANRLGRSRYAIRLTEFDGNLTSVAGEDRFARGLEVAAVSPTSLESWAGCPFRYFLGNVLRLSALEAPEETAMISALERGSLIHGILERFVVETEASGVAPGPGSPWDEESYRRLMELAEQSFAEAEARGVTGKPLLWDLAKQDMREDLTTFLEEDARLRTINGTQGVMPELRFGLGGETPEVADEGTGLSFRGIIDRLDLSAGGDSALVIDYKTGSSYPYRNLDKDPIDRGKRLQLGVYSLAARHLVPGATQVRAAYWFTTNRGGFQFFPRTYFDIDHEETAERFRFGVSTIVEGIRAGVFPANPGASGDRGQPENCRFCDFDSLCPSRRIEIWERKKEDPLLDSYLRLASGEPADAGNGGE